MIITFNKTQILTILSTVKTFRLSNSTTSDIGGSNFFSKGYEPVYFSVKTCMNDCPNGYDVVGNLL